MSDSKQPSLSELMKTAQKMQEGMQQAREQLKHQKVEGSAGGNLVIVTMNGEGEILSFKISEQILTDVCGKKATKEVLEDLCQAACNDAKRKIEKVTQDLMMEMTKKLGLPPEMGDIEK